MAKAQVFENKKPILGINGLGRIGKLTLWNHLARKYFQEIVVNTGREVGTGIGNHCPTHRNRLRPTDPFIAFFTGSKPKRLIEIVDEKAGKMLIDGIPVTDLKGGTKSGGDQMAELWGGYGRGVHQPSSGTPPSPLR